MYDKEPKQKPFAKTQKAAAVASLAISGTLFGIGVTRNQDKSQPPASVEQVNQAVSNPNTNPSTGLIPGAPLKAPKQTPSWDLARELKDPAGLYKAMENGGFTLTKGGKFPAPEGISPDPNNPKDVEIVVEDPGHYETVITPAITPRYINSSGTEVQGSTNGPNGPLDKEFEHDVNNTAIPLPSKLKPNNN